MFCLRASVWRQYWQTCASVSSAPAADSSGRRRGRKKRISAGPAGIPAENANSPADGSTGGTAARRGRGRAGGTSFFWRKGILLPGPVNTIRKLLGGKGNPSSLLLMPVASFVATGTACSRHPLAAGRVTGGKEPPLSLLSMPVRLLRRLTGTACGRHPVAASRITGGKETPLASAQGAFPSPQAPHPSPTRFFRGNRSGRHFYLFEIECRFVLTGPGAFPG